MGHAQVCEQEIHAVIIGIFSSASDQALQRQPHSCSPPSPLFLVSIIWEGDIPGDVIVPLSCRKSYFLLAQSCTEVNMSIF